MADADTNAAQPSSRRAPAATAASRRTPSCSSTQSRSAPEFHPNQRQYSRTRLKRKNPCPNPTSAVRSADDPQQSEIRQTSPQNIGRPNPSRDRPDSGSHSAPTYSPAVSNMCRKPPCPHHRKSAVQTDPGTPTHPKLRPPVQTRSPPPIRAGSLSGRTEPCAGREAQPPSPSSRSAHAKTPSDRGNPSAQRQSPDSPQILPTAPRRLCCTRGSASVSPARPPCKSLPGTPASSARRPRTARSCSPCLPPSTR